MHLHMDDIQAQRNKKYGFNDSCLVLKAKDINEHVNVVLLKTASMSYFTPKGKARMKVEWGYNVYVQGIDHERLVFERFTNKAEALKAYKFQLKRWEQMTDGSLSNNG